MAMVALRPRSSFQEMMDLVEFKANNSRDEEILEILGKLKGYRQEFEEDLDLLEAVIQRLERILRSRQ